MNAHTLEQLIEISRTLAEQRALEPLLEQAMNVALQLMKGEYGYLILLGPRGEMDFRVRQDWHGNQLDSPESQVSRTIFEHVIAQRKSLLTADAVIDPNLKLSDSILSLRLRSVVCVPLMIHERVLGALYMENRSEREIFEEDDVKVLEYFASYLAISVENAQLNQELERRVEERTVELKSALEDVAWYSGELMRANTELSSEVSIRRQVEDQLRKLSRVVEQSPDGVAILDTERKVEYINPAFTALTGYASGEIVGQKLEQVREVIGISRDQLTAWKRLSPTETYKLDVECYSKSGQKYWQRLSLTSIRNATGVVTHYAAIKEDITLQKKAEAELREMAMNDPLTGIYNRRHFFSAVQKSFQRARRYHESLSALMIDADHFKAVNDTHGHQVGDEVLRALAGVLTRGIRTADVIGRYGGEEFVIALPRTGLDAALILANRLREQIAAEPLQLTDISIPVTVSIGVATYLPGQDLELFQVLERADQALYRAKHNGRNRVET